MRSYVIFLSLGLLAARHVRAFTVPRPTIGNVAVSWNPSVPERAGRSIPVALNMAPKDPSRSGTKTGRMEKLAEMEKLGTSTDGDNAVFLQAAGAFAAFIVLAIAAAAASGLLTQY